MDMVVMTDLVFTSRGKTIQYNCKEVLLLISTPFECEAISCHPLLPSK